MVPKVACSAVKTALLTLSPDVDPGENFGREVRNGAFAYRLHSLFDRLPHQIDK